MKRIICFLFCLLFCIPAVAECVSVANVTKCRNGSYGGAANNVSYFVDGANWSRVTATAGRISGYAEFVQPLSDGCDSPMGCAVCYITYPFYGETKKLDVMPGQEAEICATEHLVLDVDVRFENEVCPDGFFTMSHDASCGEGLVDIDGIPNCDSDVSGIYCVIGPKECVPADAATKCARLPDRIYMNYNRISNRQYDNSTNSWSFVYDNRSVFSGTTTGGDTLMEYMVCQMTSPFSATMTVLWEPAIGPYYCTFSYADYEFYTNIAALPGDACPAGFYTVSYDAGCGDGFVDVARIPSCDDDTSGGYCVIMQVTEAPCELGISKLMVSTGLSFQLYAEKYTEPALHIGYNGGICYAKLEQGAGALNIRFNDIVYHVVE